MSLVNLLEAFKIIIITSIFFVWVVRYENIIKEFNEYNLPNWLRDLVGILKLSFSFMLLTSETDLIRLGSLGIAILMIAAMLTHFKVKNPIHKALPSFCLFSFSTIIFMSNV